MSIYYLGSDTTMLSHKNLTNKIFKTKNSSISSFDFDGILNSDGYSEKYQRTLLKRQLVSENIKVYRSLIHN
jgi:hypothetical protein